MFEKLLSLLPYNPGLAQQLSFYSQRMREEAGIRRTGMIFIVLAFMVQFFAVLSPPAISSADINSPNNNLITAGLKSAADAKNDCTQNIENYGNILSYYGISCDDVGKAVMISIKSIDDNGNLYSMGRWPCGSGGAAAHNANCSGNTGEKEVTGISGTNGVFWRRLASFDTGSNIKNGSLYQALQLTSNKTGKTFWLETECGNLVSVGVPSPYVPAPQPPTIVGNPTPQPITGTPAPTPKPTPVPTPQAPPVLGINSGTCNTLIGWASENEANSSEVIKIEVYADGPGNASTGGAIAPPTTFVGETTNNGHGYPGTNPSWTLAIPASYQDAAHTYYIYAVNTDNTWTGPGIAGSGPVFGSDPISAAACAVPTSPTLPVTPTPPTTPTTPTVPTCATGAATNANGTPCNPCTYDSSIATSDTQCKPCPAATSSSDTSDCVVIHKTAANTTQSIVDANNTTAHPGDVIVYTLSAQNTGKAIVSQYNFQENLNDVLAYATVTDLHGGSIDGSNIVTWAPVDIAAGATATVQITVTVKDPIPQTPPSTTNPTQFDLTMTNTYGNTINIHVPGTPTQTLTTTATTLPNTGPGTGLFIAAIVLMVAGYFYARARLLAKESVLALQNTQE